MGKVIVTGGAGFIGSHLVDRLVELGADVVVVDNLSYGKRENINRKATFAKVDVRNYDELKAIIKDAVLVYHLAAIATTKESAMGWKDPLTDYEVNAIGTLNVLRAIVDLSIDPIVVYTSSASVYGSPKYLPIDEDHPTNPISPYGVSKLAGEKYCLAYHRVYGVKTIILRIFNAYGPRQTRYVMLDLLKKLEEDPFKLEVLGNGEQTRDYCYISDVVNALILSPKNLSCIGEVFNVATGNPVRIKDLIRILLDVLGLSGKTKVFFTGESWNGDIPTLVANIAKIRAKMGFRPEVGLREGIARLVDWFYKNKLGAS